MNVKIVLEPEGKMPERATPGSAGWDLFAAESAVLNPGETKAVSVGFKCALPSDMVMLVCSRSGLALNKSLTVANSPGVVDSDYRGVVKAILTYQPKPDGIFLRIKDLALGLLGKKPSKAFKVEKGAKIAQALIQWAPNVSVSLGDLDETKRGDGGFGSTGMV